MEDKAFIDQIVTEVLNRLRQRQKKALVLFTGGTIGAQAGLEALCRLKKQGWFLQVVLTLAAERALGVRTVADCLPGVPILTEENGWPPGPLLQEYHLILVPVLTINSAAKIAVGIADNLVTTLILEGLLMGKPVLAAQDACHVASAARSQLGMNRGTPALTERLNNNLKLLTAYGIQLVSANELASAAIGLVESFPGEVKDQATKEQSPRPAVFTGGVLSRSDVVSWKQPEINVSQGTVITPLAWDLARERGLQITVC